MYSRGFTIVEIVITITIMGILLVLAVVNLSSSQVNSRDAERKGDIEAIALHLESYYANESSGSQGQTSAGGTYPGTTQIANATSIMPDIDPKSLHAPNVSLDDPMSLTPATNATQTVAGISPSPTISQYVYQPLTKSGALCATPTATDECRKFNLYYRLEADDTVYKVTSKNQ
ncbi:prepilin-type N-terminal cleavage/methylation domain-containing protein [Candidatus Saccharibacteria bacterium]|nr:prepilin-type N-terminal cleavage/methylation domain-containing protein [Candidatus Saccharibacteria bacterium]